MDRANTLRRARRTVRACVIAQTVLGAVLIALIWAVAGLSMRAGLVPFFDLGYGWFDVNVVAFFGFS